MIKIRNVNPMIWIMFALMAFSSLRRYDSVLDWVMSMALILPAIVIGLSFHEWAHAWAAYKLGDPTAKNMGRMTVSPTAHFDPFGFLALLFLGFGWGVPVPVNPSNFRNRQKGEIFVSLAGITMNLVLAVLFGFLYVLLYRLGWYPSLSGGMTGACALIVYYIVQINLVLLIFNLIPCPPLDGFNFLCSLVNLQTRRADLYYKLERNGFWILLILILFNITDYILSPCVGFLMNGIVNLWALVLM